MPPLPAHEGWGAGWCLISDVLVRLPLSIFVKLVSLTYEVIYTVPVQLLGVGQSKSSDSFSDSGSGSLKLESRSFQDPDPSEDPDPFIDPDLSKESDPHENHMKKSK